ncbi:Hypothetical predicted protein, partial [Marmota monax]
MDSGQRGPWPYTLSPASSLLRALRGSTPLLLALPSCHPDKQCPEQGALLHRDATYKKDREAVGWTPVGFLLEKPRSRKRASSERSVWEQNFRHGWHLK